MGFSRLFSVSSKTVPSHQKASSSNCSTTLCFILFPTSFSGSPSNSGKKLISFYVHLVNAPKAYFSQPEIEHLAVLLASTCWQKVLLPYSPCF